MIPKTLVTSEARRAWHRQNYAVMRANPERWAKELERKRLLNQRRKAMTIVPMPRAINADLYRQHGPWAQLFVIAAAA